MSIAADVIQVGQTSIARSTLKGIQVASAQSGVSFQYLLAKAAQESNFKPDAEASTSSATGLFQFTRGTWLDVFKRHGAEFGQADLANQITTNSAGKLTVSDKATEQRILALRENPETAAQFAAAYARDNANALDQSLGRELDANDLYLAHFLGAGGAGQMLSTEQRAPNVYASHVVPDAARANRSIFLAQSCASRTVKEVLDLIRSRFDNQMDRFADLAATMAGQDDANAIDAAQGAPAPRAAAAVPQTNTNALDFGAALRSGSNERATLSWFVMQELARMISSQPMMMPDDDDNQEPSTTSLSRSGFQGEDMSQVLVDSMARNNLPPSLSGAITSGQAVKAYADRHKS